MAELRLILTRGATGWQVEARLDGASAGVVDVPGTLHRGVLLPKVLVGQASRLSTPTGPGRWAPSC
ncbi:MAG: hypothetical protein R3F60_12000 [bacterium]